MDENITLGELLHLLESEAARDSARALTFGFTAPMSYRGYYEQLAFAPCEDRCVGDLLASAREALGKTFTGYKGGEYTMSEKTPCWIAAYGDTGWPLTRSLIMLILADGPRGT